VMQLGLHQLGRAHPAGLLVPAGHGVRWEAGPGQLGGAGAVAPIVPGPPAQLAGRPVPPSVQCSSTPLWPQSVPSWHRSRRRCSVWRTPLRDRRESTLSSGDTCGQNRPAGRPEAPSAGPSPATSTCTCQPRSARLWAAALPARPAPTTRAVPAWATGDGPVWARTRGSQAGLKQACRLSRLGARQAPCALQSRIAPAGRAPRAQWSRWPVACRAGSGGPGLSGCGHPRCRGWRWG
jgi:hypothetical protein